MGKQWIVYGVRDETSEKFIVIGATATWKGERIFVRELGRVPVVQGQASRVSRELRQAYEDACEDGTNVSWLEDEDELAAEKAAAAAEAADESAAEAESQATPPSAPVAPRASAPSPSHGHGKRGKRDVASVE